MRAPQLGQSKGKPRKGKARIGPAPVMGRALLALAGERPDVPMFHAVGLRGANVSPPLSRIRYKPSKVAQYTDGSFGAPCTLHLHHKSANWVEGEKVSGEGPIVTKRYTAVKHTGGKA